MYRFFVSFCLLCSLAFAQSPSEFEHAGDDFDFEGQGFEQEFARQEDFDPLAGYNRMMTGFNDTFYTYLLNPVAKGYKSVMPGQARDSIKNLIHHLLFPIRIVNNVLQAKPEGAVVETGRFMINTIFGVGGLFDAASAQGIDKYNEDFGQTLGHYGVGSGFHIVVPVLGPSNLRDLPSSFVDGFLSPFNYNNSISYTIAETKEQALLIQMGRSVSSYSYHVDDYEMMKKNSVDLYLFMKDMYENRRNKMIAE